MATPRKKTVRRAPSASSKAAARGKQSTGSGQAAAKAKGGAGPGRKRASGPINPDSMSTDVIEFITAVDDYKRTHGRPFPSWSEILDVLKGLGYRKAG